MSLLSRKSNIVRGMIVFAAVTTLVAACGQDSAEEPATAPPDIVESSDTADIAANGITSGRIVYVHAISSTSFDPDRSPGGTHLPILHPAYDRLIDYDWTTTKLVPGLAEVWSFNEENTFLELNLRKDVQFHDGEPFNAGAVAANIERSQTSEEAFDEVRRAASAIGRVEIVDDFTIRFHRNPDPKADLNWSLLESRLSENLGMMISPVAIEMNLDLGQNAAGAGPWQIVSFDRERVVFKAFEGYWDNVVRVENLEILAPKDSSALVSGLLTGEFNAGRVPTTEVDNVAARSEIDVYLVESLDVLNIYINHGRPNMDNRKLRQSFINGIDRVNLVNAVYSGFGSPTLQTFPPGHFAADPDYTVENNPYNPDRARELVIEAGFEQGIVLEALVLEGYRDEWTVIQQQMSQVGVTINLNVVEQSRWPEYLEGEYDLYLGRRSRLDPLDLLTVSLGEGAFFNPGGLIPVLQPLLELASQQPTAERQSVLRRITRTAAEEGYLHTLFAFEYPWATYCLDGFKPPINSAVDFRGVSIRTDCG